MIRSLKVTCLVLCAMASIASALSLTNTPNTRRISIWGETSCTAFRETRTQVPLQTNQPSQQNIIMAAPFREVVRPGGAGPAVLERPVVVDKKRNAEPAKTKKRVGSEGWEVRIYNDGLNTREHVARCLVQVTGLTEIAAYQTMMQAHKHGMAVVGRWVYERAEMYRDALKKNGILCDMVPVDEDI